MQSTHILLHICNSKHKWLVHNLRVRFSTTLANIDSIVSFSTKPFVNYLVLNISSSRYGTVIHTNILETYRLYTNAKKEPG
jgi:hypothetical protein